MKHPSHRLLPSLTEQRGSRLPKSPQLVLSHLRQDTQSLSGVYRSLSSTPSPLCSRQGQLTVDPQFCRRSLQAAEIPPALSQVEEGCLKGWVFSPSQPLSLLSHHLGMLAGGAGLEHIQEGRDRSGRERQRTSWV